MFIRETYASQIQFSFDNNDSFRVRLNKDAIISSLCLSIILIPKSHIDHSTDAADEERLKKLAAFQRKALEHALSCKYVSLLLLSVLSFPRVFPNRIQNNTSFKRKKYASLKDSVHQNRASYSALMS